MDLWLGKEVPCPEESAPGPSYTMQLKPPISVCNRYSVGTTLPSIVIHNFTRRQATIVETMSWLPAIGRL